MTWFILLAVVLIGLGVLEYLHERHEDQALRNDTKREELKEKALYLVGR